MYYRYSMAITTLANLSVQQLKQAVAIREQIESLERELAGILDESQGVSTNGHGGRRKLSPSARARIAAAQRLRWAKHRKEAQGTSNQTSAKVSNGRRTMSPAAKAKIAAAARARWARVKAANRNP
jgi:hypothetical protein